MIRGNTLGAKGCLYLQVYALRNLVKINLSRNDIRDEGARNLSQASYMRNLKELYLDDNHLTNEAVVAIAESSFLTKLK